MNHRTPQLGSHCLFNVPVGEDLRLDREFKEKYLLKIENPMDLGTIQSKLFNGLYEDEDNFAADVRLVWNNAFQYWKAQEKGTETIVYIAAELLAEQFKKDFDKMKEKLRLAKSNKKDNYGGELYRKSSSSGMGKSFESMRREMAEQQQMLQAQLALQNQQIFELQNRAPVARRGNTGPRRLNANQCAWIKEKIPHLPTEALPKIRAILSAHCKVENGSMQVDLEKLEPAVQREVYQTVTTALKKSGRGTGRGRGGGRGGGRPRKGSGSGRRASPAAQSPSILASPHYPGSSYTPTANPLPQKQWGKLPANAGAKDSSSDSDSSSSSDEESVGSLTNRKEGQANRQQFNSTFENPPPPSSSQYSVLQSPVLPQANVSPYYGQSNASPYYNRM